MVSVVGLKWMVLIFGGLVVIVLFIVKEWILIDKFCFKVVNVILE